MTPKGERTPASAAKQYQVTTKDLPVSCPMPNTALWNGHPRVYLSIQNTGEATCPYCGAHYTLTDFHSPTK